MSSDSNKESTIEMLTDEIPIIQFQDQTFTVEDISDTNVEVIDLVDSFSTFEVDGIESDDEQAFCVDEDAESDSEDELQVEDASKVSKEDEKVLTKKFLDGELTFSEYAALMEGNDAEDSGTEDTNQDKIVRSEEPKTKESGADVTKTARKQRRRRTLPPALLGLMGEANLRYAHGEKEVAVQMCLEIIRHVPTAPEPFETLAVLYEELGFPDKSLQFALIAAHLRPKDVEQWIRLAAMSEEKGNLKQAITCYSKAISAEPRNIDIYLKRSALFEVIGDRKKALRGYMKYIEVASPQQGTTVLEVAKAVAQKLHESNELDRARDVMEMAFNKVPDHITSEEVNLMLELLLNLKEYVKGLDILVRFCKLKLEREETPDAQMHVTSCSIPEDLPIDLQVKVFILLVHVKAFDVLDRFLSVFLDTQDPEEAGDLYLDVAEALMGEEKFEEALKLLTPLIRSQNYGLAAVWLRQAECLKACDRLEEAAAAYREVVHRAPQHLEARVMLSSLLKGLGDWEGALAVLEQDAESEVLDPGMLYERCLLLKNAGRVEEFLAVGQLLLSRHCVCIRHRDELDALTRQRRYEKKTSALKEIRASRVGSDVDMPNFGEEKDAPSVEDEYKLLRDLCEACLALKRMDLLQRLSFSALGSKRFVTNSKLCSEIEFICLLACYYNVDAYYGYNFARDHLIRNLESGRNWNMFNLILQRADDLRHNRFIMRLLFRNPSHQCLSILHANNCLVAGTYKYALSEYVAAYSREEGPMLAFVIGCTLFQMACQKFSGKKHSLVVQGLAFMSRYQDLRGEEGFQETSYNLGRAFHQLGLLPEAIHNYRRALEFSCPLIEKHSNLLDLRRETAFNLSVIYRRTGSFHIARSYIEKYIVV
ncbi:general transcription factor 3C polypeptide 3 isoform X2 [Bacillus rossius redtenbacheri]